MGSECFVSFALVCSRLNQLPAEQRLFPNGELVVAKRVQTANRHCVISAETFSAEAPQNCPSNALLDFPLHALVAHCEAIVTAPELDDPPQIFLSGFPIDRPCEPPRETQLE
ncbi:hypothetical protein CEP51_000842 [Fusarium floridanum]|uniref:Uncharacterized protein n=1 Tax=Fusarium floridanum TaxID=1325733 RepID=A0A428SK50_9HYPO|nr:hypothetical protein CEP51_000842 [Fusarium floridanum]